jgi:hypothetical protein
MASWVAVWQDVEDQARVQAPIAVGAAVLTSGGKAEFKDHHAPTMPEPGMRIPAQNVALATRAALIMADEKMVKEGRTFVPPTLQSVILIDVNPPMVAAWNEELIT